MWAPCEGVGLEHLYLVGTNEGATARGLAMRMPGLPFGFRYLAEVDLNWRLRRINFEPLDRPGWGLTLDPDGTWRSVGGEVTFLRGCLDVDLSITPVTNTLILRRLNLAVGESVELDVVYVSAPELQLRRRKQRYTRTQDKRFRLGETGFDTEFEVDDATVVLEWPGRYRRVWTADKEARKRSIEQQLARRKELLERAGDT